MKPRVAIFDFASCEGCELQVANLEEDILQVAEAFQIVSFREVMKEHSDNYDVAFVEGSINRPMDAQRLKDIRSKAKMLISLGDCACTGCVNKLRNQWTIDELEREVYPESNVKNSEYFNVFPTKAVDEVVKVDFYIRGCPVRKEQILYYVKRFSSMPPRTNKNIDFDIKSRALKIDDRSIPQYNPNKCIVCRRCAGVCQDTLGVDALGPVQRGNHVIISTPQNIGFEANGCIACGQCVYVCPVGALETKSSVKELADELRAGKRLVVAVDSVALASYALWKPNLREMKPIEVEKMITSSLREAGFSKVIQYDYYLNESLKKDKDSAKGNGLSMTSWCKGAFNYVERSAHEAISIDESRAPWSLLLETASKKGWEVCLVTPCTALKGVNGFKHSLSAENLDELFKQLEIDAEFANPKMGGYDGSTVSHQFLHPGIAKPIDIEAKELPIRRSFQDSLLQTAKGLIDVHPCLRRCLSGGGNVPNVETEEIERRIKWLKSLRELSD